MRVIAGEYRGRQLVTMHDRTVRPATDRVRQTLFDVLATRQRLEGIRVLDLFAGSGSLGIESLSRGARYAVFVELGREAARCIQHNIDTLGCSARANVVAMDAITYVKTGESTYDLVFADPPYAYDGTAGLPELIFTHALVAEGGFLLVEHTRELEFPPSRLYTRKLAKRFGRTVVSFFSPENQV